VVAGYSLDDPCRSGSTNRFFQSLGRIFHMFYVAQTSKSATCMLYFARRMGMLRSDPAGKIHKPLADLLRPENP